jgi:hypothetical protein
MYITAGITEQIGEDKYSKNDLKNIYLLTKIISWNINAFIKLFLKINGSV